MDNEEIYKKLKKLLTEVLDIDENKISIGSHLRDDLACDSLDSYELMINIEREFELIPGIINDEFALSYKTVDKIVDYIDLQLNREKHSSILKDLPMKEPLKINRLGIVKIPKFKHGTEWTEADLEIRRNIFDNVVPLTMTDDVKNSFLSQAYINIVCYCEHFRELKVKEEIPQYNLLFAKKDANTPIKLLKVEEVIEE